MTQKMWKNGLFKGSTLYYKMGLIFQILTLEEKLRLEDVVYGKDALKHYKFYLQVWRL